MPNVQHADLTDPFIHEPKGASTAAAGEVLFSNGDGTTSFRAIVANDLPAQTPMEYLGYCFSDTDQNSSIVTPVRLGNGDDLFTDSAVAYDDSEKAIKFERTGYFLVSATFIAGNTSIGGGGYSSLFIYPKYDGDYNIDETPVIVYTPNAHDHREVVNIQRYVQVNDTDLSADVAYFKFYLEDDAGSSTVGIFTHAAPSPTLLDVPSAHVAVYRLY